MNDSQENKIRTAENVDSFLTANKPIYEPIDAISDLANKVKSIIVKIHDLGQIQVADNRGIT